MTRLLAIDGSYRENGITDQAVDLAVDEAQRAGAQVEVIRLRDFPIEFCTNCRQCTQQPGEAPGVCVQRDGMHELIGKIEAADGLILASPTNFSTVTALFKRFMERLVVYAYWPWGMHAPQMRRDESSKRAVLIASCAAPGIMGRLFYGTLKQLKMTANTVGAKTVGTVFIGPAAGQEHAVLSERTGRRVRKAVQRLL